MSEMKGGADPTGACTLNAAELRESVTCDTHDNKREIRDQCYQSQKREINEGSVQGQISNTGGKRLLKPQKCLNSNQTSANPISDVLFGAMHLVKALNLGGK